MELDYGYDLLRSRKLSIEEAEDRFEETDVDQNGIITWKEQLYDSFGEEGDFDESHAEDAAVLLVLGFSIDLLKQVFT